MTIKFSVRAKWLGCVLLQLVLNLSFGQEKLILSKPFFAFYSKGSNKYKVISDLSIYTYLGNSIWKKDTLYTGGMIEKSEFFEDYFAISENENDYLVNKQCGKVFRIENSNLIRLDNSFNQRNQYNSNAFFFKKKLYLFGGYGLFTSKNIITYFDKEKKEWFLEIYSGNEKPEAISSSYSILDRNYFYVFGGGQAINGLPKFSNQVWKYNLYTKRWSDLGQISPFLKRIGRIPNKDSYQSSEYLHDGPNLYHIFPERNLVTHFISDRFSNITQIVGGSQDSILIAVRSKNGLTAIEVVAKKELMIGRPSYLQLYSNTSYLNFWIWSFFGLFLCVVGYLLVRRLYNRNAVKVQLTMLDREICKVLQSNGEQGIELSMLNELLNDGSSTYEAIKKRREMKLKELRLIFSEQYGLRKDEVILEKRFEKDRRIKLFYLNPIINID